MRIPEAHPRTHIESRCPYYVTKTLESTKTIQWYKTKQSLVFLPRILMISSKLPLQLKRQQFHVKIVFGVFGMKIIKAQGQTLKVVGEDLST